MHCTTKRTLLLFLMMVHNSRYCYSSSWNDVLLIMIAHCVDVGLHTISPHATSLVLLLSWWCRPRTHSLVSGQNYDYYLPYQQLGQIYASLIKCYYQMLRDRFLLLETLIFLADMQSCLFSIVGTFHFCKCLALKVLLNV